MQHGCAGSASGAIGRPTSRPGPPTNSTGPQPPVRASALLDSSRAKADARRRRDSDKCARRARCLHDRARLYDTLRAATARLRELCERAACGPADSPAAAAAAAATPLAESAWPPPPPPSPPRPAAARDASPAAARDAQGRDSDTQRRHAARAERTCSLAARDAAEQALQLRRAARRALATRRDDDDCHGRGGPAVVVRGLLSAAHRHLARVVHVASSGSSLASGVGGVARGGRGGAGAHGGAGAYGDQNDDAQTRAELREVERGYAEGAVPDPTRLGEWNVYLDPVARVVGDMETRWHERGQGSTELSLSLQNRALKGLRAMVDSFRAALHGIQEWWRRHPVLDIGASVASAVGVPVAAVLGDTASAKGPDYAWQAASDLARQLLDTAEEVSVALHDLHDAKVRARRARSRQGARPAAQVAASGDQDEDNDDGGGGGGGGFASSDSDNDDALSVASAGDEAAAMEADVAAERQRLEVSTYQVADTRHQARLVQMQFHKAVDRASDVPIYSYCERAYSAVIRVNPHLRHPEVTLDVFWDKTRNSFYDRFVHLVTTMFGGDRKLYGVRQTTVADVSRLSLAQKVAVHEFHDAVLNWRPLWPRNDGACARDRTGHVETRVYIEAADAELPARFTRADLQPPDGGCPTWHLLSASHRDRVLSDLLDQEHRLRGTPADNRD